MLEHKIEELIAAIDRLSRLIEAGQPLHTRPAPSPAPSPVQEVQEHTPDEPQEAEDAQVITRAMLQEMCIAKVREDKGFKALVMAQLEQYGAKNISKLPDEAVEVVYNALSDA